MLLALDVGNSQITVGLYEPPAWRAQWRLTTDTSRSADEYGVYLAELFRREGHDPSEVKGVVLSSVVPAVTSTLETVCRERIGCRPLVVAPGIRTGMEVRYHPPSSLGSDRLVNAVAARARWGAPVIVVDFGTATTFSVVDARGAFVGGAIAPGVGTSADALAEAAARLRHVGLATESPVPLIGKRTEASIRAGVLYGHASLVSGLLKRMMAELEPEGRPVPAVATGGFAGLIAPLVPLIRTTDPQLTLEGLRLVAELNGVVG